MNLELLQRDFPQTDEPGLKTTDPRLDEINTSVQEGHYEEVASQIEAVFADEVFDIRLISYYCYCSFHEQGLAGVEPAFRTLASVLSDNWETVGPAKNRGKIAKNSLNWLLRTLDRRLAREAATKGEGWNQWIETLSSDDAEQMLEATDQLRKAVVGALEEESGGLTDNLAKIAEWLRSFQQVVYHEPEAEPEPEAEEEPSDEATSGQAGADGDGGALVSVGGATVEGSYHLALLLKKLQAFERLITEEKFSHAALVADDIQNTIANFDPLLYFPKLFASFQRLVALHIGELIEYVDAKESADGQALLAYYQVDLEGFLEL